MRIYFLSCRAAALKLNGEYVGIIDGVERFVNLPSGGKILAEVIPEGPFVPVHFFIDEEFFNAPPPFLNVYLSGGEALIYITKFESLLKGLKVLSQLRLNKSLITQFCVDGKLYYSADGEACNLYEADPRLSDSPLTKCSVCGDEAALSFGNGYLIIISQSGERLFYGRASAYKLGDGLNVTEDLGGCENYFAECHYEYFNRQLKLAERKTKRRAEASREVLHFAFFERALYKCDFEALLHPSLKPKAEFLGEYLGEFTAVTVPPESFYLRHGEGNFCGLIYPVKPNLFSVKYFEVSFNGGLIDNITECTR